jgi:Radical SAM superfamily/4Fe-4S single cluster domain
MPLIWYLRTTYWRHIKPRLPRRAVQLVASTAVVLSRLGYSVRRSRVAVRYLYWRTKPSVTGFLGPRYRRSRDFLEIDLTYLCNLHCHNCNRSCTQAVTSEGMTVEQIQVFLEESVARGHDWKRLSILGGEPTLHPQFIEIMGLIVRYRDQHWPKATVQLTTNGYGDVVTAKLAQLPTGVRVINTAKTGDLQPEFDTFNVAPADLPAYAKTDFANGCAVLEDCGMGLTPYGYYPCAIMGGIDRIFGFAKGRKALPDDSDDMLEEVRQFCRLCGHFKFEPNQPLLGPELSPTWEAGYRQANSRHRRDDSELVTIRAEQPSV